MTIKYNEKQDLRRGKKIFKEVKKKLAEKMSHPQKLPPKKRARKRRTIKNSYVDLDSVTVEPGEGYIAWIPITKQKIKERECQLLSIKITKIECIVSEHLDQGIFYKIPPKILKTITNELFGDIDRWNGVEMERVKREFSHFRDYYNTGKRWWDLHKTRTFGFVFWMRVFADIREKVWDSSIFMAVICDIFHASIKYANTKPQRLVNAGTVRKCARFKRYLLSLHVSLNVSQFIIAEKQENGKKSGRKANEYMMAKLRSALNQLTKENEMKQSKQCKEEKKKINDLPPVINHHHPANVINSITPQNMASVNQILQKSTNVNTSSSNLVFDAQTSPFGNIVSNTNMNDQNKNFSQTFDRFIFGNDLKAKFNQTAQSNTNTNHQQMTNIVPLNIGQFTIGNMTFPVQINLPKALFSNLNYN